MFPGAALPTSLIGATATVQVRMTQTGSFTSEWYFAKALLWAQLTGDSRWRLGQAIAKREELTADRRLKALLYFQNLFYKGIKLYSLCAIACGTFLTPQLAQRQINSWDFYIRSSVTFTVSNQIVHTPRWVNTYLTIHLPLGILILNSVY